MPNAADISETLSKMRGKNAWGLARTHGSMFFLEFGEPRGVSGRNRVHGEWHLLVECCRWHISKDNAAVLDCEDDQLFIDSTFEQTHLGQLVDARLGRATGDLTLRFSNDQLLSISGDPETYEIDSTEWLLFTPDEKAWRKNTGKELSFGGIHEA